MVDDSLFGGLFVDMEPVLSKKPALEFLDMNDDYILAILEVLKAEDLFTLGSTCVRINKLAAHIFKRWDNVIDVNSWTGDLQVYHPSTYAKTYFLQYFRSIGASFGPFHLSDFCIGHIWPNSIINIEFRNMFSKWPSCDQ